MANKTMQLIVAAPSHVRPEFPSLPDDIKKRFPSLAEWEKRVAEWWSDVRIALQRQEADASAEITRKINAISGGTSGQSVP